MRQIGLLLVVFAVACGGGEVTTTTDDPGGVGGAADDPDHLGGDTGGTGGNTGGKTCGEQAFQIQRAIPDVLIVLDRSYSMSEGGSPTLWDMSRTAIYDLTATMDRQIWFGLYVFPSVSPQGCNDYNWDCTTTASVLVPVGDASSGAIKGALTTMQACGSGTPTATALAMAKQYVEKLPGNGHARAILLVTDGAPNCNAGLNPYSCVCPPPGHCWDAEDCLDDQATNQALDNLCAAGIKSYVLGLGSAQSLSNVLASMAQHGCTGQPYAANDPTSVKQAFAAITSGIATCAFEIDCTKIQDVNLVNFYFDGKVVPRNPSRQSGWDWTTTCTPNVGKGMVEFWGADCDAIKDNTVKVISAKFGCATMID
jgi:hypothetical protein